MPATPGECVFDDPVALAFLKCDHAPVSDRISEPRVAVVLSIQHVALESAFPAVHLRLHIGSEPKNFPLVELTNLLAVDSNSVVIGGRTKKVPLALAGRVNIGSRVAQVCSAKRKNFKRQRVRVRVRASASKPVIAAIDYRVQLTLPLDVDLSFGEIARAGTFRRAASA